MPEPLVSIILPVYNGERHLKEAIDSILSQTYKNFELLIIDDGSTDSSVEIVKSYTDKRVMLLNNHQNMGLVATLNKALSACSGKYIARMDADDIALPERLQKQVTYLNTHPNVSMIDCIMEYMDVNGTALKKYNSNAISAKEIYYSLPFYNSLGHSSVLIRKKLYQQYGYRNTDFEDYDLWLRFVNSGLIIHKIPEPLLLYRVHNDSYTISNNRNKKRNYHIRCFNTKWYYWKKLPLSNRFTIFNLLLFVSMLHNLAKGLYIRYTA